MLLPKLSHSVLKTLYSVFILSVSGIKCKALCLYKMFFFYIISHNLLYVNGCPLQPHLDYLLTPYNLVVVADSTSAFL